MYSYESAQVYSCMFIICALYAYLSYSSPSRNMGHHISGAALPGAIQESKADLINKKIGVISSDPQKGCW